MESIRIETGGIPADRWQGFAGGRWQDRIDVRDFIQANVAPYTGDAAFLVGPTERAGSRPNRSITSSASSTGTSPAAGST